MIRFDDYHRTVVGYHGTCLSTALRVINRIENLRSSEKDYDWLGKGVYFWEYAPKQALNFADIRQRQLQKKKIKTPEEIQRASEPRAVIACMIRLGFCLDLTEPESVEYISDQFDDYKKAKVFAGGDLPKNSRKYRKLDRDVFEYAYTAIEKFGTHSKVDTARGIYVPTDGDRRVWPGSWVSKDTHIQICVRNPANLLGAWLHYPSKLEVNDACKALQVSPVNFGPKNPQGADHAEANDDAAED